MEIAAHNRLPLINLTESAGADLPQQSKIFVRGGRTFRELTRRSAERIPTICLVFGSSTAGGAYVPGMSDYAVLVKNARARVPRRPAARQDGDQRGHRRGVARRRRDAQPRLGRVGLPRRGRARRDPPRARRSSRTSTGGSSARRRWRRPRTPRYDPDELLGIGSIDVRKPFEVREVIARIVDGSRFDEFKPHYGTTLVTGWAHLHGYPIGILGNNGILFSDSSREGGAVHPALQQDRRAAPLPPEHHRLHGRHAVRAGRDHQGRRQDDQRGLELDGADVHGDDRQLLRRRQLRHVRPRLRPALPVHVAEPPHRRDGAGAARGRHVDRPPRRRRARRPALRRGRGPRRPPDGREQIEQESNAFYATARVWDDGVIDPRDTRTVLGMAVSAAFSNVVRGTDASACSGCRATWYRRRWVRDAHRALACRRSGVVGTAATALALPRITTPPAGKLYHAVYPGGVTGEEDDLTPADVDAYEAEAGKPVAWVYFSQNWYRDRLFPAATATWIQDRGAVPYIRLMIRSIPFKVAQPSPFPPPRHPRRRDRRGSPPVVPGRARFRTARCSSSTAPSATATGSRGTRSGTAAGGPPASAIRRCTTASSASSPPIGTW